jgi:hypothetical protein
MFKDLHFIRLRTHEKHFIQDTVQASKTLQSRYSTTELSLSVFFSGTGTEIPVLGTRVWPKISKLLTFKNFMIYQNPRKSLHSIYIYSRTVLISVILGFRYCSARDWDGSGLLEENPQSGCSDIWASLKGPL